MNLEYGLYMAETEGYLGTHYSKMQRLLKDVQRVYWEGKVDVLTIDNDYLGEFGLTLDGLTAADFKRIEHTAKTGCL